MLLKELYLKDFRNYSEADISFSKQINIMIGNNAQGKSNILEAIYLTSAGRSHRTNKDSDMVRWTKENALVKAKVSNNVTTADIQCLIKSGKKEVMVNKQKVRKNSDLGQVFNTVLFSPEDLMLVKGGPRERRNFLDNEIAQVSPRYGAAVYNYRRVLMQRNNNLKEKVYGQTLQVWTDQLVDYGSYVLKKRFEVLEKLRPLSRLICRKITQGHENMEIMYHSSVKDTNKDTPLEKIKEYYYHSLAEKEREEKLKGITLVGPHRDDMLVEINKVDVRTFGSQGQQRTAALALKLAELEFMKSESGEYPVLLLDDVFSELDKERKTFLVGVVLGKIQTFITGTDISDINDVLVNNACTFSIKNGTVGSV